MALIEAEPKHSLKTLIFVGIPSVLIAIMISLMFHQFAHVTAKKYSCASATSKEINFVNFRATEEPDCAVASLAGAASTFFLAIGSFALLIHYPRNLFLASMAFVNATLHLPETVTAFVQVVLHRRPSIPVDESTAIHLLPFKDTTAAMVILCFYSVLLIFLTVIIIHDIKKVPWKWLVAFILFILLGPLETIAWKFVAPLIS
jgi:hypothetical protein